MDEDVNKDKRDYLYGCLAEQNHPFQDVLHRLPKNKLSTGNKQLVHLIHVFSAH